jgi:hypothetical protein
MHTRIVSNRNRAFDSAAGWSMHVLRTNCCGPERADVNHFTGAVRVDGGVNGEHEESCAHDLRHQRLARVVAGAWRVDAAARSLVGVVRQAGGDEGAHDGAAALRDDVGNGANGRDLLGEHQAERHRRVDVASGDGRQAIHEQHCGGRKVTPLARVSHAHQRRHAARALAALRCEHTH